MTLPNSLIIINKKNTTQNMNHRTSSAELNGSISIIFNIKNILNPPNFFSEKFAYSKENIILILIINPLFAVQVYCIDPLRQIVIKDKRLLNYLNNRPSQLWKYLVFLTFSDYPYIQSQYIKSHSLQFTPSPFFATQAIGLLLTLSS